MSSPQPVLSLARVAAARSADPRADRWRAAATILVRVILIGGGVAAVLAALRVASI